MPRTRVCAIWARMRGQQVTIVREQKYCGNKRDIGSLLDSTFKHVLLTEQALGGFYDIQYH